MPEPRLQKRVNYRPVNENGSRNEYPIELRTGNGIWAITEDHFLSFYQEYMEQKAILGSQALEKDPQKDLRNLAIDSIERISHNIYREWHEAGCFQEGFLDQLMLWVSTLNKLRPAFLGSRNFPTEAISQQIINLRSLLRKQIQATFDNLSKMQEV